MKNETALSIPGSKLTFTNDFGKSPLALAHVTKDTSQLAIIYGLAAFVGFVFGGWSVVAYVAFLGLNDCKFATDDQKKESSEAKIKQLISQLEGKQPDQKIAAKQHKPEADVKKIDNTKGQITIFGDSHLAKLPKPQQERVKQICKNQGSVEGLRELVRLNNYTDSYLLEEWPDVAAKLEIRHNIKADEDFNPWETLANTTAQTPQTVTTIQSIQTPYTNEDKSLIDDWLDSLMLTRCIIAGQRTGKTYAASVASYHAKSQYDIRVYYLNFNDHGQGNKEAFDHADDIVCCNWASMSESKRCDALRHAIEILDKFAASTKQLLIVDEWMCLGARVATPDSEESTVLMDHFWRRMFDILTSLNSTAAGSGKALWAICPYFKAGALREEAKAIKNAKLLILAIRPGHDIPWTDPNGITLNVTYDLNAVEDAFTNWRLKKDHPTTQDVLKWEQLGEERVYWSSGKWQAVGVVPLKPKKIIQQISEKPLTTSP